MNTFYKYRIVILDTINGDTQQLVNSLKDDNVDVVVYSNNPTAQEFAIPNYANTFPKQINFIIESEKNKNSDVEYLLVVQNNVHVKHCIAGFMQQLINLMHCLKISVWLNTVCDKMNYVYQKYTPRLQIDFNDEDAAKIGTKTLLFTSHSNTYVMCFDLSANIEKLKFNESFSTSIYYTIEFLARRKKVDDFAFMNMYPTIASEQNIFELNANINENNNEDLNKALFKEDDEKFKSMHIDYTADNNVEFLEQKLYDILKDK